MRFAIALAVLACGGRGFAQDKTSAAFSPREEICGFLGKYYFLQADRVRRGLSVEMFVGDAPVNQPVTLRFHVSQKPADAPVDDLQVEHEKLMHVIGVRDDLSGFFHIHPVKVEPGLWAVTHVFTNGGNYKLWTDVKYHGTSYAFEHPLLTVPGKIGDSGNARAASDQAEQSGYRVTLKTASPLIAGKTNQLQFSVRDSFGNQVRTEDFLGAPMHLVIVKEDLSVYLHAHTDSHQTADPTIIFTQTFPAPGGYKLFAQLRPQKAKLPPGEAILTEFFVKVEKAD